MANVRKKILLVGGGSGGHAGPIRAIFDKLKAAAFDSIIVVGSGTPEEKPFFGNLKEYRVIEAGKMHRYLTLKNVQEGALFLVGFSKAVRLLLAEKPTIIFSKGGFASLPMILAARLLKIPFWQHESDIEMGQTNRMMAKYAKKVFVAYPEKYYPFISKNKIDWSGPILRGGYEKKLKADPAIFGFAGDKPVILLTGGSQGSLHLSQKFIEALPELLKEYDIIHQAGKHSIEMALEYRNSLSASAKKGYFVTEFLGKAGDCDMMLSAIDTADLVVARAGSTIIELAIKGKPMILVPWKHSAQDHQNKNAQFFAEHQAAQVILDDELSRENIVYAIKACFAEDGKRLTDLAAHAAGLFPDDGAQKIAKLLLAEISK